MKRFLFAFLIASVSSLSCAAVNYSDLAINKSSFTLTSEGLVSISTFAPLSFEGVCVGSKTVGGVAAIVDGTIAPFVSTITIVDMSNTGCQLYNVEISSGLFYRTTGNSNGISILYRIRRPQ